MDVYDLLLTLLQHAARTGLAEHIVKAGETVIEAADPKIAEKRRAAEAAQEAADAQYQRFLAFQAMEQRAGAAAAPVAPAPVVPTQLAAAQVTAQVAPPVVTG